VRTRFWLLLGVLASAVTWFYVSSVLTPWEYYFNVGQGKVKAQMGDLYPRWVGTRGLLLYKLNPYGPEVSHEIQVGFYGHAIEQTYTQSKGTIVDEQRFAYPIYVVFLLAPTVHADFANLQRRAVVVLALLMLANILLCLQILEWRLPWMAVAALILFVLASPPIVQGLRLRQLGLVAAFLLTASVWCIRANRLGTAGALLAFSTIKPQMVLLPLVFFLIWSMGDLRRRWNFVAGFGLTLGALVAAGELLLPGWIGYFFAGLAAYSKYAGFPSFLGIFLGNSFGMIAGVVIVAGFLFVAWKNRKSGEQSPQFISGLSASLLVSVIVLPLLPPFNQVLLILPVFMIVRDWDKLSRPWRAAFVAGVSLPWIMSAAFLLFPPAINSTRQTPLFPSMAVPFLPILFAMLLAARRSAAREVRDRES